MKNFIIILSLKILNKLLKMAKKNGGNVLGKLALKWNAEILNYFKIDCPIIAVTGTNGKTMTNNAITYTFRKAGKKVVSNTAGNNMETGIISVLVKECSLTGKIKADYLVFETDESYVPVIYKKLKLNTLIVQNFFRDQLDRNGEVESLILKIENFLKEYNGNLILNNDDPNVSRLGKANPENKNVYYYSVDKYNFATNDLKEAGEGKFCPFCNSRLEYEYYQYSHIGKFKCSECGYGNNEIYKIAKNINLTDKTFQVDDTTYNVKFNSIYAIYNLTSVVSCALLHGIGESDIKNALSTFVMNNGRSEEIMVKNIPTIINLAKNPTGSNVSLRILNEDDDEKELLFVLNDNTADGHDVSWIWDVNFENLNNVSRIITAGTRCYDIAIRIKIAGFNENKIESYENLKEAVETLYKTNIKKYVIANYTALQPTRQEILKIKE